MPIPLQRLVNGHKRKRNMLMTDRMVEHKTENIL